MSRVAKMPVAIPPGVDVVISADRITVKGSLGALEQKLNALVKIESNDGLMTFVPVDESTAANAMSGTMRQLVNNMVNGVTKGFQKKLMLVGVGFKAAAQGSKLNIFSDCLKAEMEASRTDGPWWKRAASDVSNRVSSRPPPPTPRRAPPVADDMHAGYKGPPPPGVGKMGDEGLRKGLGNLVGIIYSKLLRNSLRTSLRKSVLFMGGGEDR